MLLGCRLCLAPPLRTAALAVEEGIAERNKGKNLTTGFTELLAMHEGHGEPNARISIPPVLSFSLRLAIGITDHLLAMLLSTCPPTFHAMPMG